MSARAAAAALVALGALALSGAACESEGTTPPDAAAAVDDADALAADVAAPELPPAQDVAGDAPPQDVGIAGDAPAQDIAVDAPAPTDVPAPGPFACGSGGLTCQPGQACAATGQGACGGATPGPNGCGPDCYATDCGGGTYCLCDWFECVDLPAGCETCEGCALPPGHQYCVCDDASGHVTLSCPGA